MIAHIRPHFSRALIFIELKAKSQPRLGRSTITPYKALSIAAKQVRYYQFDNIDLGGLVLTVRQHRQKYSNLFRCRQIWQRTNLPYTARPPTPRTTLTSLLLPTVLTIPTTPTIPIHLPLTSRPALRKRLLRFLKFSNPLHLTAAANPGRIITTCKRKRLPALLEKTYVFLADSSMLTTPSQV